MAGMDLVLEQLIERNPGLQTCAREISEAATLLISCFGSGGKLLVCGNGGSAADAEHIVGELMKGFQKQRPLSKEEKENLEQRYPGEKLGERLQGALPAIALGAHTALGTACANDNGADMMFAQQVWGYGRPGDVLLALSTSGNSENVGKAVKVAHAAGMQTIGICGGTGGVLKNLCDVLVLLPESETYLVQELTLPIYHALCRMAEGYFWEV